jgi:hypothetical protein
MNIECGRVSLKWPMGLAICRTFDVSQVWLAEGTEPIRPFFDLDAAQDFTMIPESMPFSAVCKGPWLKNLTLRHDLLTKSQAPASGLTLANAFQAAIENCVRAYLIHVSEDRRLDFLEGLPRALRRLLFEVELPRQSDFKKTLLTEASIHANLQPVKSQLDNLLATLNRLTKEPGNKTALADFLGAPLASVSRWLSGKRDPGGETTLKMFHWAEQRERQQSALGSAINTTKGKTQLRESSYEKPKSGPKKR